MILQGSEQVVDIRGDGYSGICWGIGVPHVEHFFVCCNPARNHSLGCGIVVVLLYSVLELGGLHDDPCTLSLVLHAGERR